MNNLRNIVENTLVPHSAFEKASSRLEQCFTYSDGAAEPICIAVIGESRTGKSRSLEECYFNHPQERKSDGLYVPILRVKTPSKPTVKGLAELMLRAMSDPKYDAGSENAKTIRLKTLIEQTCTRMVMIDEFQHFYDKASHKVMHYVSDWLKILVDDCKVALVVAGLPSCEAVLNQSEQLAGRFLAPIIMPRFDWKNGDHRDEFLGILGSFQESIGRHFDLPKLDSDEMAFRCYCGTGGLIGYLTKFLRQTVWNAIDNKQKSISIQDLAYAHVEAVWCKDGLSDISSPFSHSFHPLPSDELLARIRRIGTAADEIVMPRARTSRSRHAESVRQVLTAS